MTNQRKLKPPENYRRVAPKNCRTCYLLINKKGGKHDCLRGNPAGWYYQAAQLHICDNYISHEGEYMAEIGLNESEGKDDV